jgi:hypothetical protein
MHFCGVSFDTSAISLHQGHIQDDPRRLDDYMILCNFFSLLINCNETVNMYIPLDSETDVLVNINRSFSARSRKRLQKSEFIYMTPFTWLRLGSNSGLLWTQIWRPLDSHKVGYFLTSWSTIGFSRRTLFLEITYGRKFCGCLTKTSEIFVRITNRKGYYFDWSPQLSQIHSINPFVYGYMADLAKQVDIVISYVGEQRCADLSGKILEKSID